MFFFLWNYNKIEVNYFVKLYKNNFYIFLFYYLDRWVIFELKYFSLGQYMFEEFKINKFFYFKVI